MVESSPDLFSAELVDTDIPIDSNVLLYDGDVGNQSILWNVYRTHCTHPLRLNIGSLMYIYYRYPFSLFQRFSKFGFWSSEFGLDVVEVGQKWEHRHDLTGLHFTAATLDTQPFVTVEDLDQDNLPPGYRVSKLSI